MTETSSAYVNARNMAIDVLRRERPLSVERVKEVATISASTQTLFNPAAAVPLEQLVAELLHLLSVGVQAPTALDDDTSHVPWLPGKRAAIEWRFWQRYMTFLERDFGMPPRVVEGLDHLTDMILERLEEPSRAGPWDRRGMVVGSVQSGKTANYTGLICKAIDAGYRLVIVMAGVHSNLRAQTQLRLDEGVLGFDTQKNRTLNADSRWLGVGNLPGERLVVHALTTSADTGDFSRPIADQTAVMLGSDPVLVVVKKNGSVLNNVRNWVESVAGVDAEDGTRRIDNVPLLLIDDEADNASINTKDGGDEATAINGHIRRLLRAFSKSAYVGYTATPFANIFIPPKSESQRFGEDLFPRSFIINAKPPSNYMGPGAVFGTDGDTDAGIEERPGLPIVRLLEDYADAFPPKHKKDWDPPELPESLRKAIRCFLLTCATRATRGQEQKHCSMLVHVTRFTDVQEKVAALIREEVTALRRRLTNGDGARTPTLREELQQLWEEEFVPTSARMREIDEDCPHDAWSDIDLHLSDASAKIETMEINGYAKDALSYKEHEAVGRSVIAVGGDKLSRGLTLEGLSTSYFLRTSRMYDTLLQMGRWFGYRPGYRDLCRLYTTENLVRWYRHVALAEEELRREFDYMVAAGLTPERYGLRVRTHPDGMIITAMNKMARGRTVSVSWAGVLVQSWALPKGAEERKHNRTAMLRLLQTIDVPFSTQESTGTRVWPGVSGEAVATLLETLKFPQGAERICGEEIASFVRAQGKQDPPELTNWTVALVSTNQTGGRDLPKIGEFDVAPVRRTPESQTETALVMKKANIANPSDEYLDLRDRVFDEAWFKEVAEKEELEDDLEWLVEQLGQRGEDVLLALTKRWQQADPAKLRSPNQGESKRPNGRVVRVMRPKTQGLLLIYPILAPTVVTSEEERPPQETGLSATDDPLVGIVASFPTSDTAEGVEYRVNPVWASATSDDDYEDS